MQIHDFNIKKKCQIRLIYKLDDIVNKCNNKYKRTIKIEPIDIKQSTYIDFNKKNYK